MVGHWQWTEVWGSTEGGMKGVEMQSQRSGVDSKKYHLGCKILLSLRRKAGRHLGFGGWIEGHCGHTGDRRGRKVLPKTNVDCTAVMILDF